MPTAHDAVFKRLFSDPPLMADFLRQLLPARETASLDLSRLRLVPGSFVDDSLRQAHTDLLFHCPLKDDPDGAGVLVYVLLEHQSTEDRWMPLRVHIYTGNIWRRWRALHPDAPKLPPILPVVLHQGTAPWRSSVRLRDLIASPPGMPVLRSLQPNTTFRLYDLPARQVPQLRGGPSLRVSLVFLRFTRRGDLPGELPHIATELRALVRSEAGRVLLDLLVRYSYFTLKATERQRLEQEMSSLLEFDERAPYKTIADFYVEQGMERGLAEGRQKGIAEGRQKGIAEGRQEGRAALLLSLIERRFGPLDEPQRARVRAMSAGEQEELLLRTLSADSLEDLGLA